MDLHCLLYPATYPRRQTLLRLAQVFTVATVLSPTEDTSDVMGWEGAHIHVQTKTPVLLGERLPWFRGLMKNWEDWARQMGLGDRVSSHALLGLHSGTPKESVTAILNELRGPEPEDPVLDAQIFLSLAHELDRRQDDLDSNLDVLSHKEQTLKGILQGPGPQEPAPSREKPGPTPLREPLLLGPERLRAWVRLWIHTTGRLPWPVGEDITVKDAVDTAYESLAPGNQAVDLLSLDLPLETDMRPCLDGETASSLTDLLGALSRPGPDPHQQEDVMEYVKTLKEQWGLALGDAPTGPHLTLTVYPDHTLGELLLRAAGLKPDAAPNAELPGWSFYLH